MTVARVGELIKEVDIGCWTLVMSEWIGRYHEPRLRGLSRRRSRSGAAQPPVNGIESDRFTGKIDPVNNAYSTKPIPLAEVQRAADTLGFAMTGVCAAEAIDRADFLRDWLGRQCHGEMQYLAEHFEKRIDPTVLLPGARSIICVADRYHAEKTSDSDQSVEVENVAPRGRIARYAWGDDYHKTIKKRLFSLADALRDDHPNALFKVAVDTAPVMEREHAARAGLGWIGKHTLLIHPRMGSYFLLGEIITTLEIETSATAEYPGWAVPPTDHCGTCTRCIDACPTQCISPYQLDAKQCISYLTIEHRSLIDEDLHEAVGDWVAGCDICQEVCPHNREPDEVTAEEALPQPHPRYTPRPPAPSLDLLDILNWTAEQRTQALKGSAIKRIKLDMFKRNALIAAGNMLNMCDHAPLRKKIDSLTVDESETALVRDTAKQVLSRLRRDP